MSYFTTPKHIKRSTLKKAPAASFSAIEMSDTSAPRMPTCTRCAVNIAKNGAICEKPEHVRCRHCSKSHRSQCTLVPVEFNGRVERLYILRDAYDAAVAAGTAPLRRDAQVQATGLRLARYQRTFCVQLASLRRTAAHTGVPIGLSTQVPTTTPNFLSLILVEQRRIAAAQAETAGFLRGIADSLTGMVQIMQDAQARRAAPPESQASSASSSASPPPDV